MRIDPSSTVFIDIDTQVDFVEPHGALYVSGAEQLKPRFFRLIQAARRHSIPVVASADAHAPDDPEFEVFPPHCVAGTPGQQRIPETVPERATVVPAEGGYSPSPDADVTWVLEKVTFDFFSNPDAERVVSDTGAKTAFVFGLALDYCVRAAALGLRERGYETVLIRDATAPVTAEGGERALEELEAAGVRFATTDEVLAALD